jgi:glutamine amidotransferase
MCRWLAYSGTPIPLASLISRPENSLIHQSRASRLGYEAVNADGFGVGWYADGNSAPALFRSLQPAWADPNLEDLAEHVVSGHFVAHVRATTGTPVQPTNCHPFRHGNWLWAHNGLIRDFAAVKRDLVLAIAPDLFPLIQGTTDSEVMFHLALTFGLQDDPIAAVAAMAGFVEEVGRAHGVEHPLQMTVVTTDGESTWAFRYSSERESRSLFFTRDARTLRALHPEIERLQGISDETRLVVSEPLVALEDVWVEMPEAHVGVVRPGEAHLLPFAPVPSAT